MDTLNLVHDFDDHDQNFMGALTFSSQGRVVPMYETESGLREVEMHLSRKVPELSMQHSLMSGTISSKQMQRTREKEEADKRMEGHLPVPGNGPLPSRVESWVSDARRKANAEKEHVRQLEIQEQRFLKKVHKEKNSQNLPTVIMRLLKHQTASTSAKKTTKDRLKKQKDQEDRSIANTLKQKSMPSVYSRLLQDASNKQGRQQQAESARPKSPMTLWAQKQKEHTDKPQSRRARSNSRKVRPMSSSPSSKPSPPTMRERAKSMPNPRQYNDHKKNTASPEGIKVLRGRSSSKPIAASPSSPSVPSSSSSIASVAPPDLVSAASESHLQPTVEQQDNQDNDGNNDNYNNSHAAASKQPEKLFSGLLQRVFGGGEKKPEEEDRHAQQQLQRQQQGQEQEEREQQQEFEQEQQQQAGQQQDEPEEGEVQEEVMEEHVPSQHEQEEMVEEEVLEEAGAREALQVGRVEAPAARGSSQTVRRGSKLSKASKVRKPSGGLPRRASDGQKKATEVSTPKRSPAHGKPNGSAPSNKPARKPSNSNGKSLLKRGSASPAAGSASPAARPRANSLGSKQPPQAGQQGKKKAEPIKVLPRKTLLSGPKKFLSALKQSGSSKDTNSPKPLIRKRSGSSPAVGRQRSTSSPAAVEDALLTPPSKSPASKPAGGVVGALLNKGPIVLKGKGKVKKPEGAGSVLGQQQPVSSHEDHAERPPVEDAPAPHADEEKSPLGDDVVPEVKQESKQAEPNPEAEQEQVEEDMEDSQPQVSQGNNMDERSWLA
eukprot:gb/GEZN01001586.1/.p1 GENE.gb/GEZN01001586.1/~~gb/GEZN01001586.1/.p1  ORF type:complete len:773 (+),score=223.39 gb/GEZN01001586.1/:85-2403(+)